MGPNTYGGTSLPMRTSDSRNTHATQKEAPILTSAAPLPALELVGPRSPLVRKLIEAYWGELETVSNYVASSTNRDGIHARQVSQCMREAIACNLDHAHRLAMRIKSVHGPVPGPDDFSARKLRLEAPADPNDSVSVLTAVIEAETAAIDRYWSIATLATEAYDWITQDLAIQLAREKEAHRQLLRSYLGELTES